MTKGQVCNIVPGGGGGGGGGGSDMHVCVSKGYQTCE